MKKTCFYLFSICAGLMLSLRIASAEIEVPKTGPNEWQNLKTFTEQEYTYFKSKNEEIAVLDEKLKELRQDAKQAPHDAEKKQVWLEMAPVEKRKKEIVAEVKARDAESTQKLVEMIQAKGKGGEQAAGAGGSNDTGKPAETNEPGEKKPAAGGLGGAAASMMQQMGQALQKGAAPANPQAGAQAQPKQKGPEQVKAFQTEIQKEQQEFEKKFRAMPIGPRETAQKELDETIKKETEALQKEIKEMSPDPKELMQKEFQEKIKKEKKDLDEKMKLMPAGPKEVKQIEFNKRAAELRKALAEKIKTMPLDPKETAKKEFDEMIQKKTKQFIAG